MDYTSGDSLYIDEVLRGRTANGTAEKLSAGYELFNFACGVTRAGIRHQFPAADDNEIERIFGGPVGASRSSGDWEVEAEDEVMLAVVDVLESRAISYLLVGAFSTNFYGIPRSTKDVDFAIEIGQQSIQTVTRHLGITFFTTATDRL